MLNEWRKYGKPILDIGSPGAFDCVLVCIPSVLKEKDHYKMWYTAANDSRDFKVGLAISKDGVNFRKYEHNPALDVTPDSWDNKGVQFAQVIKENDIYKMWYAGFDGVAWRTGLAVSKDGITWSKEPDPVLDIGQEGEFDGKTLLKPTVIKDGDIYRMAYAAVGDDTWTMRLGLATSPDGKEWVKYSGNPVIEPESGKWDCVHIEDPHLIKLDKYYLTYAGKDEAGNYRIGLAVSDDGIHYTKEPKPILDLGSKTSFEALYVAGNYLFCDPPKLVMYYHGRDPEGKERMSLAYCCDPPPGFNPD